MTSKQSRHEEARISLSYLAVNHRVGAIGPMCLREDDTIQQNGVVLLNVGPAHAGDGRNQDSDGYFGLLRCRREAFCIGGAALFIKKEIFEKLGGFAEDLPLNYNDVDFCLRLRELGYTCVVDPDICVYHFEGASKVGTSPVEQELLFSKHPGVRDPYFSKWFDQGDPNYRLKLTTPRKSVRSAMADCHIAIAHPDLRPSRTPQTSVCVSVYDQPKRLLQCAAIFR